MLKLKIGDHFVVQLEDGSFNLYEVEARPQGVFGFRFIVNLRQGKKLEELLVVLKDIKEQQ